MNIYLAGPCDSEHRSLMMNIKQEIIKIFKNDNLYCPFELKIPNAWNYSSEIWSQKVFDADIKAMNDSDFMIVISYGRISSIGTGWEQGYMWAKEKPIFVLQVNNNPTSLMTYCGCKNFYNVSENIQEISDVLKFIAQNYNKTNLLKKQCMTVLT